MDIVQLANELCSKISSVNDIDIGIRQKLLESMSSPKNLNIEGSKLKFYVHSITEDGRIRKFKEPWTVEWLRNLPAGAVLYDVGANIGITSLIPVENIERNICVVAIEPAPANFASLVKNIELNGFNKRVYALPIGLGAITDIACFNLTTHHPGGAMHSFGEILLIKTSEPCRSVAYHYCLRTRLDDLVDWKGMPFPTHIKIDIDGGEFDLLSGASRVLNDSRCQGAQIEIVDIDATHVRSKQVIEIMMKAGFSVKAHYDHNNTFPRVTDIQFARA